MISIWRKFTTPSYVRYVEDFTKRDFIRGNALFVEKSLDKYFRSLFAEKHGGARIEMDDEYIHKLIKTVMSTIPRRFTIKDIYQMAVVVNIQFANLQIFSLEKIIFSEQPTKYEIVVTLNEPIYNSTRPSHLPKKIRKYLFNRRTKYSIDYATISRYTVEIKMNLPIRLLEDRKILNISRARRYAEQRDYFSYYVLTVEYL